MYIFVGKFSGNGNGNKYLHLTHISAFRHQIGRLLIVHVLSSDLDWDWNWDWGLVTFDWDWGLGLGKGEWGIWNEEWDGK